MDAVAPAATKTQVVQELYRIFGEGNIPALIGTLPQLQVWRGMGAPQVAMGRDYPGAEVGAFFQALGSTLNITQFTPHTFVEQGDHVVALGTMSGTAHSTGQPFSTRWAHHWKFQDGQVIEFNDHFDSLNIYAAQVAEPLPQR